MGTNYYFFTKDKEVKEDFYCRDGTIDSWREGIELVDDPDFGYMCHLNKCSYGWRPLFERHFWKSFYELEQFYMKNKDKLIVLDEYGNDYSFEKYKEKMIKHSEREPVPQKWVYEVSEFTKHMYNTFHDRDLRPTLKLVECKPEEADLYIPINHREYQDTQCKAARKFHTNAEYFGDIKYWDDPDYKFDWTAGDFS